MLKILHTSDWHLGQKFLTKDRYKEHQLALDWLLQQLIEEQIDMLIVAGDIFDIGSPPNYARKLYYNFLTQLILSPCRHILIIGGNHDSPSMLEAPKDLLESLNIRVVGAVPENWNDQIIPFLDEKGKPELVVGAVPFLRDRDLKKSTAGEDAFQRIEIIKSSIRSHYQKIADQLAEYQSDNIPLIVTGHLHASGALVSGKQTKIYIGDIENIQSDEFPDIFDYVALGHIHRAQKVGNKAHIRYSGSIIPLSFSETKDDKSVSILHFEQKKLVNIESKPVPLFRRLKTIKGTYEEIAPKILAFAERHTEGLTAWLEVLVETDKVIPNLGNEINELVKELNLEVLKVRLIKQHKALKAESSVKGLDDLDVMEVFRKKYSQFGAAPEDRESLEKSFLELQNWMQEKSQE